MPAYAESSLIACEENPDCYALLKPAVTAPTDAGEATTITTSNGAAVEAAAEPAVVEEPAPDSEPGSQPCTRPTVCPPPLWHWRYWNKSLNEQAQLLAQQKYCAAYRPLPICGDGFYTITYTAPNTCQAVTVYAFLASYAISAPYPGPFKFCGGVHTSKLHGYLANPPENWMYTWTSPDLVGDFQRGITGQDGIEGIAPFTVTPYPMPRLPWSQWSFPERASAVARLSGADWAQLIAAMPEGGILAPGDTINAPKIVIPGTDDPNAPQNERHPQIISGPYKIPGQSSSPSPTPPPPPPEPEPEPEPGSGGAMQGGGNLNWNWKSRVTFQHTFDRHGQGSKNTKNLAGRAAGTGEVQGQWLDNQKAAQFLQDLRPNINGPTIVEIPPGLGQVILPDGSIIPATHAQVVPTPIGGYKTAYPVVPTP